LHFRLDNFLKRIEYGVGFLSDFSAGSAANHCA